MRQRGCGQTGREAAHEIGRAEHLPRQGARLGLEADALEKEVFAPAAARSARLEADTDARTVADAVVGVEVADPPRRLASDRQAAHAAQGEAAAHDDVFRGAVHAVAELVAAPLDGDVVVAAVGRHILDKHVAAAGDVHAVAAGRAERTDADAADHHVFAVDGGDVPESGLLERDALQIDVAAADRSEEGRELDPAAVAAVEQPFGDGRVGINVAVVLGAPRANRAAERGTDQPAPPRQGDVVLPLGVDAGTERIELDPRIGREDRGQKIFDLAAEAHLGALLDVQFDPAFEDEAARRPDAAAEHHATAALAGQAVDRLLNLPRTQRAVRAGLQPHVDVAEKRLAELRHIKRCLDRRNRSRTGIGTRLGTRRHRFGHLRGGRKGRQRKKKSQNTVHDRKERLRNNMRRPAPSGTPRRAAPRAGRVRKRTTTPRRCGSKGCGRRGGCRRSRRAPRRRGRSRCGDRRGAAYFRGCNR